MADQGNHDEHTPGFMAESVMVDYFTKKAIRPTPETGTKNVIRGLTEKEMKVDFGKWFDSRAHGVTYPHHDPISGKKRQGKAIFNCDTITDEWFKWFFTVPGSMSPSANPGKLYGDRNSQGDRNIFLFDQNGVAVYFAAISPFQNPDVRTITLTRPAPLLVPVYNVSASLESYPTIRGVSDLAKMVKYDLSGVHGETFSAKFDQYDDLYGCCVVRENPLTIAGVPAENIFGIPEERLRKSNWTTQTCHGGFWLLIKEKYLTPGDHLLAFDAQSINYEVSARIHIRCLY
jgi:hypothetical protein